MLKNRDDAEDLTQDVFIKVFSMLERYDDRYAFRSWVFKIAANQCIDFIRKNRVKLCVSTSRSTIGERRSSGSSRTKRQLPMKNSIGVKWGSLLRELTDELPPHYRAIIVLRHQEQLSYEEIAEMLELPLGTVKARIHRARAMMKEKLIKRRMLSRLLH